MRNGKRNSHYFKFTLTEWGMKMLQNIKTDIIYYKTTTDFEMEFNLCGCCRMRLLTDKAPDRKSLVHNLARAVSRSRIILIIGSLFGDEGTLTTVAGAISKKLAVIDNSLYGITDKSEIKIIDGATPLVSPDGCFGGCIIESGPQAMILLSDNKSLRKSIMTALIHPYVEELAAAEMHSKAENARNLSGAIGKTENIPPENAEPQSIEDIFSSAHLAASAEAVAEAPIANATESLNEENGLTDDIDNEDVNNTAGEEAEAPIAAEEAEAIAAFGNDEAPLNPQAAAEADGVELDGGMIFETDDYRAEAYAENDEYSDLYIEPVGLRRRKASQRNELYSYDDTNEADFPTDGYSENSFHGNPIGGKLTLIVLIILLLTAAVLCYSVFFVPAQNGISPGEYVRDIFNTLFG